MHSAVIQYFIKSSSLFNGRLYGKEGNYYNTSSVKENECIGSRVPFPSRTIAWLQRWISRTVHEFAVTIPGKQVLLEYIDDGQFLDKQTKNVRAQFVTYNPMERALGLAKADFPMGQRMVSIKGVCLVAGTTGTSTECIREIRRRLEAICSICAVDSPFIDRIHRMDGEKGISGKKRVNQVMLSNMVNFAYI